MHLYYENITIDTKKETKMDKKNNLEFKTPKINKINPFLRSIFKILYNKQSKFT